MKFLHKLKHVFIPSEHNVYRPHILRKPVLIFFLTIILTAEGVFIVDILARQSAINFLSAVLAGEVVSFTNEERAQDNLATLQENTQLDAAAQAKADDMAAKGYFSHTGPDGKEPWVWITESGYRYSYAGENLAVRFTDSRDVVNAWMASPSHKANIVKPAYTQIGVGVAQGDFQGKTATYVVQYFGTPQGVSPVAINALPETATPSVAAVSSGQVAGVATQQAAAPETAVTQKQDNPWGSFARELAKGNVMPSAVIPWILGGVAALIILGLALAFFIHMQVQAADMLMGGAVVAVIALSFIALNVHTPFVTQQSSDQTAAVFGALPAPGGFIDSSAASVQSQ